MLPLYVDCNATMPLSRTHLERVLEESMGFDGNPSSIHGSGRNAKVALERARAATARLLGCRDGELVFVSGATEANNAVLQGVANRVQKDRQAPSLGKPHFLVSAVEHPSVLDTAKLLAERGMVDLELVPADRRGLVEASAVVQMLRPTTVLVAVMHANNEVGTINDVLAIAAAVKERNAHVHFHTDAVQTFGKLSLQNFATSHIDSAAISGHKVGALKGVGALYLKSGVQLGLLLAGGGQERSRRAGTENMPGIISLGLRSDELYEARDLWVEAQRVRDALARAVAKLPGGVVHTPLAGAIPNTLHFHVDRVAGDDLLLNLDLAGVQAASGSACSSGVARPSHVLLAMGYDEWVAKNSVRISFLPNATVADAERIMEVLRQILSRLT